jgi:hypothetical protein
MLLLLVFHKLLEANGHITMKIDSAVCEIFIIPN